jgi:hypothetical protein
VDETFDTPHQQEHMEWSTQPTLIEFPVFVVWRNVRDVRGVSDDKGRIEDHELHS